LIVIRVAPLISAANIVGGARVPVYQALYLERQGRWLTCNVQRTRDFDASSDSLHPLTGDPTIENDNPGYRNPGAALRQSVLIQRAVGRF
jgi:hypothetical protein